ncbi:hypothetical protein BKA69DRAFT_281137 [Paraphysoderma sedebokerense]|nr:hypothetical protein BKA69DRAFT_281137 [Paraphysoderma sedebokerense]
MSAHSADSSSDITTAADPSLPSLWPATKGSVRKHLESLGYSHVPDAMVQEFVDELNKSFAGYESTASDSEASSQPSDDEDDHSAIKDTKSASISSNVYDKEDTQSEDSNYQDNINADLVRKQLQKLGYDDSELPESIIGEFVEELNRIYSQSLDSGIVSSESESEIDSDDGGKSTDDQSDPDDENDDTITYGRISDRKYRASPSKSQHRPPSKASSPDKSTLFFQQRRGKENTSFERRNYNGSIDHLEEESVLSSSSKRSEDPQYSYRSQFRSSGHHCKCSPLNYNLNFRSDCKLVVANSHFVVFSL